MKNFLKIQYELDNLDKDGIFDSLKSVEINLQILHKNRNEAENIYRTLLDKSRCDNNSSKYKSSTVESYYLANAAPNQNTTQEEVYRWFLNNIYWAFWILMSVFEARVFDQPEFAWDGREWVQTSQHSISTIEKDTRQLQEGVQEGRAAPGRTDEHTLYIDFELWPNITIMLVMVIHFVFKIRYFKEITGRSSKKTLRMTWEF